MIYGFLIVLITCFQPKGVIGIVQQLADGLKKKDKGVEGHVEAAS
jgi:hypothetical protein